VSEKQTDELNVQIGLRLRAVRTVKDLTISQFTMPLAEHKNNYSRVENGKVKPKHSFLQSVCKIYNVNITWLLTGVGEMFLKAPPESSTITSNSNFNIVDSHNSSIINTGSNIASTPASPSPASPTTTAIPSIQPYLDTIAALKESLEAKNETIATLKEKIETLKNQVTTLQNQLQTLNQNP